MSRTFSRLLTVALSVWGITSPAIAGESGTSPAPVVVELFTSQGCNSCPPADAFLGELAGRADLIALAFHVDYWNYIGWKDPFSSSEATRRQRGYAQALDLPSIYTPQMVIDGHFDAIGSDRVAVQQAIIAASQRGKLSISVVADPNGRWHAIVPEVGMDASATVWLVSFDRQHVTSVRRGENAGKALVEYNIVRGLHNIGQWNGARLDIPLKLDVPNLDEHGYAVIVQTGETGAVLGAALIPPGGS